MDDSEQATRAANRVLSYREPGTVQTPATFYAAQFGVALTTGLAWGIAVIAAGHGAAPMGLLLFANASGAARVIQIVAWLGVVLLGVASFIRAACPRRGCAILGLAALVMCWCFALWVTELPHLLVLTSLPFFALAALLLLVTLHPRARG